MNAKKIEFERIPYLLVTAMSAQGARDFFGGSWFKTLCVGQDTTPGKKFGARTYKLFRTEADWLEYQKNWKEKG
jgi:hypothetical protein